MNVRNVAFLSILLVFMSCAPEKNRVVTEEESHMHDFDKLWNYNQSAETEQKFRDALVGATSQEQTEYQLELRTQLARTLGLQQKFEDAHQVLDQVEQELTPEYSIAKIRYLLERGRTLNSSGKQEESIQLFLEAWELGLEVKADFYAVDAAHMLGIVAQQDQQLIWNEKAMALAEKSPDKRAQGWLGSLYNNIGWTYHDLQDYEKAMAIFLKALDWREAHEQVIETRIAKWCVARTHRSLGNIDKALIMQFDLEKEMQVAGQDEDGYVFEEIGECLTLQGKPEEAAPYFMKAWTILSQDIWLKQNEGDRLDRLKTLGEKTF